MANEPIFTADYAYSLQGSLKRVLSETPAMSSRTVSYADLQIAHQMIQGIPPAATQEEKMERAIFTIEA